MPRQQMEYYHPASETFELIEAKNISRIINGRNLNAEITTSTTTPLCRRGCYVVISAKPFEKLDKRFHNPYMPCYTQNTTETVRWLNVVDINRTILSLTLNKLSINDHVVEALKDLIKRINLKYLFVLDCQFTLEAMFDFKDLIKRQPSLEYVNLQLDEIATDRWQTILDY